MNCEVGVGVLKDRWWERAVINRGIVYSTCMTYKMNK